MCSSDLYVEVQIEVAKQKGGVGFLFWNANNDYSKPYAAMPEMRTSKNKDRYFRGDEIGVKPEPAVSVPVAAAAPMPSVERGPAQSPTTQKIWRH